MIQALGDLATSPQQAMNQLDLSKLVDQEMLSKRKNMDQEGVLRGSRGVASEMEGLVLDRREVLS